MLCTTVYFDYKCWGWRTARFDWVEKAGLAGSIGPVLCSLGLLDVSSTSSDIYGTLHDIGSTWHVIIRLSDVLAFDTVAAYRAPALLQDTRTITIAAVVSLCYDDFRSDVRYKVNTCTPLEQHWESPVLTA